MASSLQSPQATRGSTKTPDAATEHPLDPIAEIKAMTAIAEAFRGLDPGQIRRALEWVNKHYLGHSPAAARKSLAVIEEPTEKKKPEFADFPTLLAAAPQIGDARCSWVTLDWAPKSKRPFGSLCRALPP